MQVTIDGRDNKARALSLALAHGVVQTPIFMPVGTQGAVKALDSQDLYTLGASIILANTYHMYLRLGIERLQEFGGVHKFANFSGNYLSDSGGFQAFSLSDRVKVLDSGIAFKSHIDGTKHIFTPKLVLDVQYALNSDIMMVLDDLVGLPATNARIAESIARTTLWAKQSLEYHNLQKHQGKATTNHLFAIIQGGVDMGFRKDCATQLLELGDFDGYAIGGLAVGESESAMQETISFTTSLMPESKPRYLMGVGTPENIIEAIARGVDMFDCVMPTRNARNATLFTHFGKINIKSAAFINDTNPIDSTCSCHTCKNYTRAYLCHLYRTKELSFFRLATLHNLHYYLELVRNARVAIINGEFMAFRAKFYADRNKAVPDVY